MCALNELCGQTDGTDLARVLALLLVLVVHHFRRAEKKTVFEGAENIALAASLPLMLHHPRDWPLIPTPISTCDLRELLKKPPMNNVDAVERVI